MWGRLIICGRLAIGLPDVAQSAKRVANPLQDAILPHVLHLGAWSAFQKGVAVCLRRGVVFSRRPTGELFIVGRRPGSRLDFEADRPFRLGQDRMPHPRGKIDAPEVAFRFLAAEPVTSRDRSLIVEKDHVRNSFQNKEGFGLRRIGMAMRAYIGSPQQDVQKPVWVISRAGMEVVIHSKARRFRGKRRNGVEQRGRDQFHFSHRFKLSERRVGHPLPAGREPP
jgi:hypothetical protein